MEKTMSRIWADGNKAHDHAFRAAELMQAARFLDTFKPVHHRYNASTAINALRKEAAMSLSLGRSYDAALTRRVWQRHYKSLLQAVGKEDVDRQQAALERQQTMTTSEIRAKFLLMDGDDEASIADVAMECFNCRRAELLPDGSVLIADPQAEQILSDEKMQELFDFVADRNSGICAQCGRELEAGEVVTCDTCDRRYHSK